MNTGKKRGVHVKGYYTRARMFAYLMLSVAVVYILYYVYTSFVA